MSIDVLQEKIRSMKNPVMVGLDPYLPILPRHIVRDALEEHGQTPRGAAAAYTRFCTELLDALRGVVPAVKLQSACFEALGADGIAAINTVKSVCNVDLNRYIGMPIVDGKSSISGYSGKAVKPIALRFLQQMRSDPRLKDLPISGIGGIETWEDAAEFILMGATTLQMTTSCMQYGYRVVEDMKNGLMHYMAEQGVDRLEELVGRANANIIPAEELNRDYIVYPKIDEDKCLGCGRCYISCYDGAHQAMEWDEETRKPHCNTEKCVGCHLCALVCPVSAISKGEIKIKPGRKTKAEDVRP